MGISALMSAVTPHALRAALGAGTGGAQGTPPVAGLLSNPVQASASPTGLLGDSAQNATSPSAATAAPGAPPATVQGRKLVKLQPGDPLAGLSVPPANLTSNDPLSRLFPQLAQRYYTPPPIGAPPG